MPTVLFVHNGSPGRFAGLAAALRSRGWTGALLNGPSGQELPGYVTRRWAPPPDNTNNQLDAMTRSFRDSAEAGRQSARLAAAMKAAGFSPDVIIGHPGWGEMLFLAEVFQDVPQIQVAEYYYHSRGADVGFDPEFGTTTLDQAIALRARNANLSLNYVHADLLVAPTRFQRDLLPVPLRSKTVIIHEGIDTQTCRRIPSAELKLTEDLTLTAADQVVTFVNRFFEPMRGFHTFMRCLPSFLSRCPNAHAVLVGSDAPSGYGIKLRDETWKQRMLRETGVGIDPSRVHFVDQVSYNKLISIFSVSSAHVYLTYPFVLSWSILDAMSCSCLIVASDTQPVREIIKDGQNGILTDFFDPLALATKLQRACEAPAGFEAIRQAARETVVANFDRESVCMPHWISAIENTVLSRRP